MALDSSDYNTLVDNWSIVTLDWHLRYVYCLENIGTQGMIFSISQIFQDKFSPRKQ